MRNCVPACLPWAAAHERLANSKSEATLEEAGWQRLRGLRAAILKEQKSASASDFHFSQIDIHWVTMTAVMGIYRYDTGIAPKS